MKKYLAIRAKTLSGAKKALEQSGATVLKSSAETIDPAVRNLVEGFHARGLEYDINGLGVYWLLVEDDRPPRDYLPFSAVETVFSEDWLLESARKVRFLKGIAYCDATAAWSEGFPLKDQKRTIEVQLQQPDMSVPGRLPEEQTDTEHPAQPESTPTPKPDNPSPQKPSPQGTRELLAEVAPKPQKRTAAKPKTNTKKPRRVVREEQLDLFAL